MQEETQEYAAEKKLRELVQKYSEFVNFPIYLYDSKQVDATEDEDAAAETEDDDAEADSQEDEISDEGKELH